MAIKRILVPVDASPNSIAALETAAELASLQKAELLGLFVEDHDLLRYSDYGFASEVSLSSCRLRSVDKGQLELQMRARAERMRSALARAGEKWNVPWQFRVSRGGVTSLILDASSTADLTVLGKVGWSLSLGKRTGSTVRALISSHSGLTLILQEGARLLPTVYTVFTGSELSRSTLASIEGILRFDNFHLIVYIPETSREAFHGLRDLAISLLPPRARAEFRSLPSPWNISLVQEIHRENNTGPLILPCDGQLLQNNEMAQLVGHVSNPVLLVKGSQGAQRKD